MAWVTHAHPFSVLALTGSGFYVPGSTAGASLPWQSLPCLKRKSKDLQSPAGALDKLGCLEDAMVVVMAEKGELETLVGIADMGFIKAYNEQVSDKR